MSPLPPLEIGAEGKRSFILRTPIMPAAGFLGYGRVYPGLLDPRLFGALVTRTTTLRPLGQQGQTRGFARSRGGFIMPCPPPNPGIQAVLREFAASWRHWQVPVIVALHVSTPEEGAAIAARLEHEGAVSAVELQLPRPTDAEWLAQVLNAFHSCCDLPVLAKLPLGCFAELAGAAVDAGAAGLVSGTPHPGADLRSGLAGPLYGPAVLAHVILALKELSDRFSVPLIASGGIYGKDDAEACLAAGAAAVQLDGVIFLDPALAADLARAFAVGDSPR